MRTTVIDARVGGGELPTHVVLHVGAAAVPAIVRRLEPTRRAETSVVRLILDTPLPLQVGDRVLLRDPGRRHVVGGATVLDPAPPPLRRRGAAKARAASLATDHGNPDAGAELKRRGAASRGLLAAIGVPVGDPPPPGVISAGSWLVTETLWEEWRRALHAAIDRRPPELLDAGVSHADLARALHLDDPRLVTSAGSVLPRPRGRRWPGAQAWERAGAPVGSRAGGVATGRIA